MSVSIVKYDLARSRNHAFNILIKRSCWSRGRLGSGRTCRGDLRSWRRILSLVIVA